MSMTYNNRSKSIALTLIWAILFFSLYSCAQHKKGSNIRSVQLISEMPMPKDDSSIIYTSDTLILSYYNDNIVLQFTTVNQHTYTEFDKDGNTLKDSLVSWETVSSYFIYKKGDSHGLKYSAITSKGIKIQVDSFLRKTLIMNFEQSFSDIVKEDSIVQVINASKNTELVEKYIPKTKIDQTYNDSTIVYYSDFPNIDFSFSKFLDSTRKKKVTKVVLKYNYNPAAYGYFARAEKTMTVRMKDLGNTIPNSYLEMIKKFDSDSNK